MSINKRRQKMVTLLLFLALLAVSFSFLAYSVSDSDGDGVRDEEDLCPLTTAPSIVDLNGCSCDQKIKDGTCIDDNNPCTYRCAGPNAQCNVVFTGPYPTPANEDENITCPQTYCENSFLHTYPISSPKYVCINGNLDTSLSCPEAITYFENCGKPLEENKTSPPVIESTNGYVFVSTTPTNAEVYLDGVFQGYSELNFSASEGTHTLELKLAGYENFSISIPIYPMQTTIITRTFTPIVELKFGYLQALSTPSGANVYINNEYKGASPLQITLNVGFYNILFTKENYTNYTQSIEIKEKRVLVVNANLNESIIIPPKNNTTNQTNTTNTTTPLNGILVITTNPTGANLDINSVSSTSPIKATSPVTLSLEPGLYGITASYEGYKTAINWTTVISQKITYLNLNLEKEQFYLPAPKNLRVINLTNTSVTLAWDSIPQVNSSNNKSGYYLLKNSSKKAYGHLGSQMHEGYQTLSFTDYDVKPLETYHYQIIAYANLKLSLPSDPLKVVVPKTNPPIIPFFNISNNISTNLSKVCIDTDGGLNYGVFGKVTYCSYLENKTPINCTSKEDMCVKNSEILSENYCAKDGIKSSDLQCKYGCQSGICLPEYPSNLTNQTNIDCKIHAALWLSSNATEGNTTLIQIDYSKCYSHTIISDRFHYNKDLSKFNNDANNATFLVIVMKKNWWKDEIVDVINAEPEKITGSIIIPWKVKWLDNFNENDEYNQISKQTKADYYFVVISPYTNLLKFSNNSISIINLPEDISITVTTPGHYTLKMNYFDAAARSWISVGDGEFGHLARDAIKGEKSILVEMSNPLSINDKLIITNLFTRIENITPISFELMSTTLSNGTNITNNNPTSLVRVNLSAPLVMNHTLGETLRQYKLSYLGEFKNMNDTIELGYKKVGDKILISHISRWNDGLSFRGRSIFPVALSTDTDYYNVKRIGQNTWQLTFDDGVKFDYPYNDGQFIINLTNEGDDPNECKLEKAYWSDYFSLPDEPIEMIVEGKNCDNNTVRFNLNKLEYYNESGNIYNITFTVNLPYEAQSVKFINDTVSFFIYPSFSYKYGLQKQYNLFQATLIQDTKTENDAVENSKSISSNLLDVAYSKSGESNLYLDTRLNSYPLYVADKNNTLYLLVTNKGFLDAYNVTYNYSIFSNYYSFTITEKDASSLYFNGDENIFKIKEHKTINGIDSFTITHTNTNSGIGKNYSSNYVVSSGKPAIIQLNTSNYYFRNKNICLTYSTSWQQIDTNTNLTTQVYYFHIGECKIKSGNIDVVYSSYKNLSKETEDIYINQVAVPLDWLPEDMGHHLISFFVEDESDPYEKSNSFNYETYSKLNGPNLQLDLETYLQPSTNFEGSIAVKILNDGTKDSQETHGTIHVITNYSSTYLKLGEWENEPFVIDNHSYTFKIFKPNYVHEKGIIEINDGKNITSKYYSLEEPIFLNEKNVIFITYFYFDDLAEYASVYFGTVYSNPIKFNIPLLPGDYASYEDRNILFNVTLPPVEKGEYAYILTAGETTDVNPNNNCRAVFMSAVDDSSNIIFDYISTKLPLSISLDKVSQFNFTMTNIGKLPAKNTNFSVTLMKKGMSLGEILSLPIPSIGANENFSLIFNFTPDEIGSYYFNFRIISEGDLPEYQNQHSKSIFSYYVVEEELVDFYIAIHEKNHLPYNLYFNQSNNFTILFQNRGKKIARNATLNVSIDGKEYFLKRYESISSSNGTIELNFSFTPKEKRPYFFKTTITSPDANFSYNDRREYVFVSGSPVSVNLNLIDTNSNPISANVRSFAPDFEKTYFGQAQISLFDTLSTLSIETSKEGVYELSYSASSSNWNKNLTYVSDYFSNVNDSNAYLAFKIINYIDSELATDFFSQSNRVILLFHPSIFNISINNSLNPLLCESYNLEIGSCDDSWKPISEGLWDYGQGYKGFTLSSNDPNTKFMALGLGKIIDKPKPKKNITNIAINSIGLSQYPTTKTPGKLVAHIQNKGTTSGFLSLLGINIGDVKHEEIGFDSFGHTFKSLIEIQTNNGNYNLTISLNRNNTYNITIWNATHAWNDKSLYPYQPLIFGNSVLYIQLMTQNIFDRVFIAKGTYLSNLSFTTSNYFISEPISQNGTEERRDYFFNGEIAPTPAGWNTILVKAEFKGDIDLFDNHYYNLYSSRDYGPNIRFDNFVTLENQIITVGKQIPMSFTLSNNGIVDAHNSLLQITLQNISNQNSSPELIFNETIPLLTYSSKEGENLSPFYYFSANLTFTTPGARILNFSIYHPEDIEPLDNNIQTTFFIVSNKSDLSVDLYKITSDTTISQNTTATFEISLMNLGNVPTDLSQIYLYDTLDIKGERIYENWNTQILLNTSNGTINAIVFCKKQPLSSTDYSFTRIYNNFNGLEDKSNSFSLGTAGAIGKYFINITYPDKTFESFELYPRQIIQLKTGNVFTISGSTELFALHGNLLSKRQIPIKLLEPGEIQTIPIEISSNVAGLHYLSINAFSQNDMDNSDNFVSNYLTVLKSNADLGIFLKPLPVTIANGTNYSIGFSIKNNALLSSGKFGVSLISSVIDTVTLIQSPSKVLTSYDYENLAGGEYIDIYYNFTANLTGKHVFSVILDYPKDSDLSDNIKNFSITVVPTTNSTPNISGISIASNEKLQSAYSKKEIFLISDSSWKEVLSLVPISTWTGNETWCQKGTGTANNVCVYPTLIFHQEENAIDMDSIVNFIKRYSPEKITLIGTNSLSEKEKNAVLYALTQPISIGGAGVLPSTISLVETTDMLSKWKTLDAIVYSQDDYEVALMASVFASYINSPLIIADSNLDIPTLYEDRIVYCIGENNINLPFCTYSLTLPELKALYSKLTKTDKLIVVNPQDLSFKNFNLETYSQQFGTITLKSTSGKITDLNSKNSLVSPFLASAKHELITGYSIYPTSIETESQFDNLIDSISSKIKSEFNLYLKENVENTKGVIGNKPLSAMLYSLSLGKGFENAEYKTIKFLGQTNNLKLHMHGKNTFSFIDYQNTFFVFEVNDTSPKLDVTYKKSTPISQIIHGSSYFLNSYNFLDNKLYLVYTDYNTEITDSSGNKVPVCKFEIYNLQTNYYENEVLLDKDCIYTQGNLYPNADSLYFTTTTKSIISSTGQATVFYKYNISDKTLVKLGFYPQSVNDVYYHNNKLFFALYSAIYYIDLGQTQSLKLNEVPLELKPNLLFNTKSLSPKIIGIKDDLLVYEQSYENLQNGGIMNPQGIFKEFLTYNLTNSENKTLGKSDYYKSYQTVQYSSEIGDYLVWTDTENSMQCKFSYDSCTQDSDCNYMCTNSGKVCTINSNNTPNSKSNSCEEDDSCSSQYCIPVASKYYSFKTGKANSLALGKGDRAIYILDNGNVISEISDIKKYGDYEIKGFLTLFATPNALPMQKETGLTPPYDNKIFLDAGKYADFDNDHYPNVGVGRLFGFTSSDVSSYIALDLFMDKLPKSNSVYMLSSSFTYMIEHSGMWTKALVDSGYEGKCVYTPEYNANPIYCSKFNDNYPNYNYQLAAQDWKNRDLIQYLDHGGPGYSGISSSDIPMLQSTLVFSDSCSTCSTHDSNSFCLNSIRNGALLYTGAVSVAWTGNEFYMGGINDIYYNQLPLGYIMSKNFKPNPYTHMTGLFADPTLVYSPKYKLKEPLQW